MNWEEDSLTPVQNSHGSHEFSFSKDDLKAACSVQFSRIA
jgi:hypothetical protein